MMSQIIETKLIGGDGKENFIKEKAKEKASFPYTEHDRFIFSSLG